MTRSKRITCRLMAAADRALTAGWRDDLDSRDRARAWAHRWRQALARESPEERPVAPILGTYTRRPGPHGCLATSHCVRRGPHHGAHLDAHGEWWDHGMCGVSLLGRGDCLECRADCETKRDERAVQLDMFATATSGR